MASLKLLCLAIFACLALTQVSAGSELVDVSSTLGANGIAGLRITTTQIGLNKFLTVLLPLINQQFQTIQLPAISMEESVPVVGKVKIDITNIWIRNFNIPHGTVLTSAPDDVFFEIGPGVHLHLTADFHWRKVHWPHLSGHGSIEATPDGGDIKVKIGITPGTGGHFHVHVDAASCDFRSFSIKFHGGLAWIVNIFVRLLKEKIKHAIDDAVAKQIHPLIDNNMNAILGKIPVSYPVGTGAGAFIVNIPLVQATANNNWLDLGFPLSVTNARGSVACPIPIPDIPLVDTASTARMLQIFMGQHFFNCALWVNYQNGVLDLVLPSNTSQWLIWIPAMALKWPNAAMDMRITMWKLGALSVTPAGVSASFDLSLNLTVKQIGTGPQHAANLQVSPSVTFKLWIDKGADGKPHLFFNIATMKLAFAVIDSAVGPIDLSLLQGLTNLLTPILTKAIDDLLKNGFLIPVHAGLGLTNDEILYFNQYILIEADFVYTSPPPPAVSGALREVIAAGLARDLIDGTHDWVAEEPMTGDDVVRGV